VTGTHPPLRVALDGTPLLLPRTGIGEVVAGLVGALAPRDDVRISAFAVTWRGRATLAAQLPAGSRAATALIPARFVRRMWLRTDHPTVERWTGAVDVVHATNFVPPPARVPVIVTVHDLGFARFPELCAADAHQYPTLIRRGLARGALVHATSDYVADEVRAEFGLPEERVVRVYSGVPRASGGDAAEGRRVAGAERYVVAFGTAEPRKNYPVLVAAFDAVAASDPDLALVIAGGDGWGTDALAAALDRAAHRDRVHRLGYVTDAERRDLLAGAQVLCYPSKYEGFGFPPLEAMAACVPVVTSRAGALPEVTAGAALLVDPDDVDGLAAALTRVLGDDELRRDLVERGHARVRDFTWEDTADGMMALYRRAVGVQ